MFSELHPLESFFTFHAQNAREALASGHSYAMTSAEPVVAEIVERLGPGVIARRYSGCTGWVISDEAVAIAHAKKAGIKGPDFFFETSYPAYENLKIPLAATVLRATPPAPVRDPRAALYPEFHAAAQACGIEKPLTDAQWRLVALCFPRRSLGERQSLDAFFHLQRTGCRWSQIPGVGESGIPVTSVRGRIERWIESGALVKALGILTNC